MSPIRHVLAATDLSAPARHAADRAASLARGLGASLDLVHVAQPTPLDWLRRMVGELPEDLPQRWLDESEAALGALAASLKDRHGIAAGTHVTSGALSARSPRIADATSADLIVLGARGSSFVRHFVLGSTAERLVSTCTRPMLVVRQIAHEPYRSVLVPVDFSAASAASLRRAAAVAPGARLRLLHAFERRSKASCARPACASGCCASTASAPSTRRASRWRCFAPTPGESRRTRAR